MLFRDVKCYSWDGPPVKKGTQNFGPVCSNAKAWVVNTRHPDVLTGTLKGSLKMWVLILDPVLSSLQLLKSVLCWPRLWFRPNLFVVFTSELRSSVDTFIITKVSSKTFSSLLRTDQTFIHIVHVPSPQSDSSISKFSVIHCHLYTHTHVHTLIVINYFILLLLKTIEIMHQVDWKVFWCSDLAIFIFDPLQ